MKAHASKRSATMKWSRTGASHHKQAQLCKASETHGLSPTWPIELEPKSQTPYHPRYIYIYIYDIRLISYILQIMKTPKIEYDGKLVIANRWWNNLGPRCLDHCSSMWARSDFPEFFLQKPNGNDESTSWQSLSTVRSSNKSNAIVSRQKMASIYECFRTHSGSK